MDRIELLSGQRIQNTRLSYIEDVERTNPQRRRARFICDCGNEICTDLNWVRFLSIRSCGCYKKELVASKNAKHLNSIRGAATGAYRSWQAMHQRIKANPNYRNISICDRWSGPDGFANFLTDMGERPEKHSIERIDNSKGYEPSNCKWATQLEQAQNTSHTVRVTIGTETHSISEWCRVRGLTYRLVKQRRLSGMSIIEAICKPINASKQGVKRCRMM